MRGRATSNSRESSASGRRSLSAMGAKVRKIARSPRSGRLTTSSMDEFRKGCPCPTLGSLEPRFWLVALQQGDQELLIGFWILGAKNRRRAAQAVQSHQFGCGRFFLLLVHCFNHIVCSFSCCERTLGENPLGGHHLLLRGTAYPAGAGQQLACHPDARGRSQA
jgi:hypothetical protein